MLVDGDAEEGDEGLTDVIERAGGEVRACESSGFEIHRFLRRGADLLHTGAGEEGAGAVCRDDA